ncbi:MAG: tetratricopeptide repeat protein [Acidobacteriota bacterium]
MSNHTFSIRRTLILVGLTATLVLISAPTLADETEQTEFIGVMHGYLQVAEQYTALTTRSDSAVYFAIEGIVEVYERRGELDKAVQHLEKILDAHGENQAIRNLVRFKLRDLYNETGRSQRALEELDRIIAENADAPPSR